MVTFWGLPHCICNQWLIHTWFLTTDHSGDAVAQKLRSRAAAAVATEGNPPVKASYIAVMVMAICYNWLIQWDYSIHFINEVVSTYNIL